MRKKLNVVICMLAVVLLAAGCSGVSNAGSSIQEFFGFNRPTHTPIPAPTNTPAAQEQKTENSVVPEADPFGTSKSGSSMADLDWDSFDPALIEPDTPATESKNNEAADDWKNDPDANSFSPSSFSMGDEGLEKSEQKQGGPVTQNLPAEQPPVFQPPVPQPNQPAPYSQTVNQPPINQPMIDQSFVDQPVNRPPAMNYPSVTFYPIRQNPVFQPMCVLPRTGFPTGFPTLIKKSVTYAKTNMSISIPTLNVRENIVIVPLVDGSYPVESLGDNIGLLEGSGPGKEDLFVLAAHNHLNNQEQGPFVKLSAMKESDLIFISGANNSSRTFVVYANEKFAEDDIDGLGAFVKPGCMILITCEDESVEGGYLNRRVIFAEAKEDA